MRPSSRAALVVFLLVLMGLGFLTQSRARVWHDDLSLWTDAVQRAPRKPRPWINLGLALERAGDVTSGMQAHQAALALSFQPRLSQYQQVFSRVASETNIARVLAQSGEEEAAERILNDIIARHPNFAHARYNRGILYARTGRCEQGLTDFVLAAQLDAGFTVPECPSPAP